MTTTALPVLARSCNLRRSTDRPRRRHFLPPGFTLIELIVVLVLISIMGAIAMPKYASALNRYRADAAARRIAADLGYARSVAIATSTTTSVQFNCNAASYQIAGVTDPDHGGTFTVSLSGDPYQASISSASAVAAIVTVSFNGYGIPTSTPSIVVTSNDATRTVAVIADTGSTTVN